MPPPTIIHYGFYMITASVMKELSVENTLVLKFDKAILKKY